MSAEQVPWPMGYAHRAGMPSHTPFDSMAADVAFLAVDEQAYWHCLELDRNPVDDYPLPLTTREVMCIGGEFIERFGYDAAGRFIAEVLAGPDSDECEFLELRTNLRRRFGRRAPLVIAGCLAVDRAVTGHGSTEDTA